MEKECKNITDLPLEIITWILQKTDYNDIISFGLTSKRHHYFVYSNRSLWKTICLETLPQPILKTLEEHCNGDWFKQIKDFIELKKEIISNLLMLSPKFHSSPYLPVRDNYYCGIRKIIHLMFNDTVQFFKIATRDELSYYYTIHILQEVLQIANRNLNQYICEKPYTLTEQNYGKNVLSYVMHTFLSVKWARWQATKTINGVHSEAVINFFVQWVDPAHLYTDESVDDTLNELVDDVKDVIQLSYTKAAIEAREEVTDREILYAVSQVLYGQKRIAITSTPEVDTLNIVKVLNNKCGDAVALAVIYHAVARKCGVKVNLFAFFPNHLFLEWKDDTNQRYKICLDTGELKPLRTCPFSHSNGNTSYSYCSSALLKYIYSMYLGKMAAFQTWHVNNCLHLDIFLGVCDNHLHPYKKFFSYLSTVPEIGSPYKLLDMHYLNNYYREIILTLTYLNIEDICRTETDVPATVEPKKHDKRVLFAVGMICYHKKFKYTCIVHDWDVNRMPEQPIYSVIAADRSEHYVSQEHLNQLFNPTRLYHLEDWISSDFSHFDGFAYVMNDEKRAQYPDEAPIIEMYRNNYCTTPSL